MADNKMDFIVTLDNMFGPYARIQRPEPSKEERLEYENSRLKSELAQYVETFQRLQKQANPYAVVVATRADTIVINFGGKTVEVQRGKHSGLRPGSTVKLVAETMQILDVVDSPPAAGEVCTVSRVSTSSVCEIDRAGTARAVSYYGTLEEGDRVVLDASGSVVVANLGKPPNDCTMSDATGVTWDDIGGLVEAKKQLREAVEAPTLHADLLARYGKKPIKGVLLYGAPGCGKTMLGKAAATALGALHGNTGGAFFYVKGPELLNMYVGASEQNVRNLFTAARRHKKTHGYPAIVFIDEADAILGKRGSMFGTLTGTVVPAFLAEMDGLQDSGALVLLATNRPDTLDPAIVRDGRIDRRIKVSRPSREDAREILLKRLEQCGSLTSTEALADAASDALYDSKLALYYIRTHATVSRGKPLTLGHIVSGAMLAGVVDRATSIAMQRALAGGEVEVSEADMRAAVQETFRQAQDINHADEIAEFCEGWEQEVVGVDKARGRTATDAN